MNNSDSRASPGAFLVSAADWLDANLHPLFAALALMFETAPPVIEHRTLYRHSEYRGLAAGDREQYYFRRRAIRWRTVFRFDERVWRARR
ncbi:hypothetical protein CO659_03035 [Rhizobium sp. S9]|uniref:Uncharacterized protein n=1 Tax=Rhizobium esperanzae TaxID=1967781 RepID=A0A246DUX3_9HYPH|nr:hypothetical protein B5E41_15855 [Rhizobium esperanzae]PDS99759.1 hypothetical protein CO659_03035 [Rhizobium sp. S9]